MAEGMKLYKRTEALASELEGVKEIGAENVKKFEELVRDFFKTPTQESGFPSAIIWQKITAIFDNHFADYYRKKHLGRDFDYAEIVMQCYIDCFATTFLEMYDIVTVDEIFGDSSDGTYVSDEVIEYYDYVCSKIEAIGKEIAEYLAREHVALDGMSKMTTEDGDDMSKFIDNPGIPEHEGLWIRVWIVQGESGEVLVRMIIVPQTGFAAAVTYDITNFCEEWISELK